MIVWPMLIRREKNYWRALHTSTNRSMTSRRKSGEAGTCYNDDGGDNNDDNVNDNKGGNDNDDINDNNAGNDDDNGNHNESEALSSTPVGH